MPSEWSTLTWVLILSNAILGVPVHLILAGAVFVYWRDCRNWEYAALGLASFLSLLIHFSFATLIAGWLYFGPDTTLVALSFVCIKLVSWLSPVLGPLALIAACALFVRTLREGSVSSQGS